MPFAALPPEAPVEMPVQSLQHRPPAASVPSTAPRGINVRRALVIGGAVLLTVAAAGRMNQVLNGNGASTLGVLVLVLFVMLFAWIALAFTSVLGGVWASVRGRPVLGMAMTGPLPPLATRTALLMPTYNENPGRVMAGMEAMVESLRATGRLEWFDVFILSDTTQPDVWIAEEAAFLDLRARTGAPIFYRRRPLNTERKAGNIGDWVRRWGGAYPFMLTLDADSLMEGETIVRIAAAMEQNPGVGLIQTLPVIVGGTTLFARVQQFAGRVYGPLIAHGITWWHGSEGNYWGHNAIIRTRAFAEQAGLPSMPGRRPFGGHILSHDFVEAALLRRGGWAVHMVPALGGSYEESPPSLTDVAVRDRRWAQGNLQHSGVLRTRGLHWISRLHMAMGIGSYITSPLWLVFLLLGLLISLQARFVRPEYFGAAKLLFPNWPVVDPVLARWMFIATMSVLLAPKLLAYILLLGNREQRRGCGGALRTLASLLLETLLGGLIAPTAMLIHASAVAGILLGRDSGWNAQRRDINRVAWRDVWAGYWRHTTFGAVLAVCAYLISPALFAWMLPVLAGLGLAIPLVALTASRTCGRALRRVGLLQISEERSPPPLLVHAAALRATLDPKAPEDAIQRLMRDPALLQKHRAMLPPPRVRGHGPLNPALVLGLAKLEDVDSIDAVSAMLTQAEIVAILGANQALDRLEQLAGHRAKQ